MSHEDYGRYKTVWQASSLLGNIANESGGIRYLSNGTYVLFGETKNQFEDSMASIVLGDSKESAILTLEDLRKIVNKEVEIPKGGLIVNGVNGKKTTIYKSQGSFAFETEYVAGESFLLWHMKRKFEEIKDAIRKFDDGTGIIISSDSSQNDIITESPVSSESKPSQDDTVAELMNRIASLESKIVELESKPENLSPQDRRKALQAEYDQCQKDIDAKKQEIKRLSDEVKELNARKNKLDNMLRSPNV